MRLFTIVFVSAIFSVNSLAQNVAERIERLTTDVENLKKNATPISAGLLTPGVPIRVQSSTGRMLARIEPDNAGAGQLEIGNAQGRRMAWTSVDADGGLMLLYSKAGNEALSLGVSEDGTGVLAVLNASGEKTLVMLEADGPGTSGVVKVKGPAAQFQVNGAAHDYAEVFDVADRGGMRPGSVVAEAEDGRGLLLAAGDYNSAVVGVIAGAGEFHSGMVIGSREDGTTDLPVATGGQVFVRVCPEAGAIAVGDLLVSSGTPGVAMRGADPARLSGTVVGKALQPFSGDGEGLIRMLVLNR